MRDQYAGDVSDVIKFALLRALVGTDRKLGVAWYYAPGDDGKPDGRHLEWRDEPAWRTFDAVLHKGLSALPERSIAALQRAPIWPMNVVFHREVMPAARQRSVWAEQKRTALDMADVVFLDPDNGIGKASEKHATYAELAALRKPGRALVFITFPGRSLPHDQLVRQLQERTKAETGAETVVTLRTNISVPASASSSMMVQRQRWFTIIDADNVLTARAYDFAEALSHIPRIRVTVDVP